MRSKRDLLKRNTQCYTSDHFYPLGIFVTALQLVEFPFGDGIEVVFGGGRRKLLHKNQSDPEYPDKKGERLDGRDLIQMWLDNHNNSQYVWNKQQFDQIDVKKVDHVIGMSRERVCVLVITDYAALSSGIPWNIPHERFNFILCSVKTQSIKLRE